MFYAIWLVNIDVTLLKKNLKERKVIWIWAAFYVLHVVSYFYSLDKSYSAFDLTRKLSLLLFPIVIGGGMKITTKDLERIFLFFIAGVSALAIFCLARAVLIYLKTHQVEHFFYHPLVEDFDPNAVYCALYSLFSLSVLLFFPFSTGAVKYIKLPLIVILLIFFILLSSRTLIALFFVFIIPYYVIFTFRKKKKGILFVIALAGFYISLAVAIFTTKNPIRERYTDIIKKNETIDWIKSDYKASNGREFNNLSLRLFLWRVAVDNVSDGHLWWTGAGNGSATILQNKKMSEYGIPDIYNESNRSPMFDINTHNMYVQTLLELGIPGVLLLLIMGLSFISYIAVPGVREICVILNITVLILMMQESVLETQAGIIFYALFTMVMYNYSMENRRRKQLAKAAQ